jgi:hypothetical protein
MARNSGARAEVLQERNLSGLLVICLKNSGLTEASGYRSPRRTSAAQL